MSRWLRMHILGAVSVCATLSAGVVLSAPETAASPTVEQQRKLYQQSLTLIKRNRTPRDSAITQLADYPLLPYLKKAELQRHLRELPTADVDAFLNEYDGTVAARQLRQSWLNTLASRQKWQEYLRFYREDEAGKTARCRHLEALHLTGETERALDLTSTLWLSGSSLPDACDRAFQRWENAGLKSDELVWRRLELALNSGNSTLAHFISRGAPASIKTYTRRMMRLHRHPRQLAEWLKSNPEDNRFNRAIVTHALVRLARRDYALADRLRKTVTNQMQLSHHQFASVKQAVGRQVIASNDNPLQWLLVNDPDADDAYLLEWRIRLALKELHWSSAQSWISLLPEESQHSPRWRYWLARTVEQTAGAEQAEPLFRGLANERNYYGFMAARAIDSAFDLNHESIAELDDSVLGDIPAIQRAAEFYALGEMNLARSEWNAATATLDQTRLLAATALAHRWGWHNQAIRTTIQANHWNDIDIRFPMAYSDTVLASAQTTHIGPDWIFAIARQESAFASDATSPVGARGLMQLMPGTASGLAKSLGIQISTQDLYQPEKNIALGSNYLKQLLDTFGNPVLATAAYNAGPNNVQRWLKQQPLSIGTDIWIETLPYYETRDYVQNVIAFSVIYSQRLGIQGDTFFPAVVAPATAPPLTASTDEPVSALPTDQ